MDQIVFKAKCRWRVVVQAQDYQIVEKQKQRKSVALEAKL